MTCTWASGLERDRGCCANGGQLQIMPRDRDIVDLQSGAGSQQLIQVVRSPDLRQADEFVAIRNG